MIHEALVSPSARHLAERLVATLPTRAPGLFNPWQESCEHDTPFNTVEAKRLRLAAHLNVDARWIMVGEAPGYQGCRYTGVAFTSEKLLVDGVIPRIGRLDHRLTTRERIFSEPSATVVWKTLHSLGIAEHVVLWNALQLHPFDTGVPWSNRTPRPAEIDHGAAALDMLLMHFPVARVVAVGKKAEGLLSAAGVREFVSVRHPSMGGATDFATQLGVAVANLS